MDNTVETLSIKGLRGFAEREELKLAVPTDNKPGSGLTILVGPNNGGKSTITEALDAAFRNHQVSFPDGKRNQAAGDKVSLRLAGADAWLGMDKGITDQMPDKPLWLSFYSSTSQVGLDETRSRLGDVEDLQSFEWIPNQICLSVDLPVGADQEATLAAAVSRLEHIAKLIDPQGPTYADHS